MSNKIVTIIIDNGAVVDCIKDENTTVIIKDYDVNHCDENFNMKKDKDGDTYQEMIID